MSSKMTPGLSPIAHCHRPTRLGFVLLGLLVSLSFLTTVAARGQRPGKHRPNSHTRRQALRRAALTRQLVIDRAQRNEVQLMISRDNTTGEDSEIRRAAINALGHHAGTVVVMDPKTGHVFSIVNQEWALRRGFKPCSTIKLVTGLAGLNERLIHPNDTVNVSRTYQIDLTDALAYSNNSYFQQVGGRVGFDKMISYARQLGLGEKTGINLLNEFQGQVPATKSGFAVNHMSSHGDDFKVTAVQLATLVSAMANGGKLLSPHISRSEQEEGKFKTRVRRLVNLDLGAWAQMVPGMVGAVNYGSGRRAYDPAATVVGKTGTCIEQGSWVGLFASYAPLVNPRLAVVVIARGADAHGHFPAAVAGQIYRDLNSRFGTPIDLQLATKRDPSISGRKVTALNEEEADETGSEALESDQLSLNSVMKTGSSATAAAVTRASEKNMNSTSSVPKPLSVNSNLSGSNPVNNKVKLVLMPIPQRPSQSTHINPTKP